MIESRDPTDDAQTPGAPPYPLAAAVPDATAGTEPQQAGDVARWRKLERARLIAARLALPAAQRAAQTLAITEDLNRIIPVQPGEIISLYWPIRAEPDLRQWMRTRWGQGMRIALPVALALRQPLVFHEWHPGAVLVRGLWNIPYPADGIKLTPSVLLAPLVGFDNACYRLGYGGGFFDRTLAGMAEKPLVIGLGYRGALLRTIFPQPHDIPMDWIVTGSLPPLQRRG